MTASVPDPHDTARILVEALPYMQRYDAATVVVKYGGNAMGDASAARWFAQDVAILKEVGIDPVVVHGGGPQIGGMLDRLGIKSEFKAGLRVTDRDTVDIVEMILAGSINKQIVASINAEGGRAIGLSGKDGGMVAARKVSRTIINPTTGQEEVVDLGFVGEPERVDRAVLDWVIASDFIPVVAPVATAVDGPQTYNVNADTFAGAIAGAVKAKRLLMLTDVPGVLDRDKNLIHELSVEEARRLIADGTISGGMLPKISSALDAAKNGVNSVHIVDGRVPHCLLLEILTDQGVGTMISSH